MILIFSLFGLFFFFNGIFKGLCMENVVPLHPNIERLFRRLMGGLLGVTKDVNALKTIYLNNDFHDDLPDSVATIGFFDGVHQGHQYLIRHIVDAAKREGRQSLVITFDRHPRQVLHADYQPELLTTLDEKLILLSRTGIDAVAVLHFDEALASLSAYDFMQSVLCQKLHVKTLYIGYDHRFGHNRTEGFPQYVEYGKTLGIDVVQNPALNVGADPVSSSLCRRLIAQGDIAQANRCLGYAYTLVGRVIGGEQQGRRMGFPTANLDPHSIHQMVPQAGVYAVKVRLQQSMTWYQGMMNIGTRPTFGGKQTTLEVHLFQYSGDLYGKLLLVAFHSKIREEQTFPSVEALRQQLVQDKEQVINHFNHLHE